MRKQEQHSVMVKNLRVRESKIRTHTHTQIGTKSMSLFKGCNSYKMTKNLTKVTRSLYIVTNLGQLPFMLFTQMARTSAVQRDSVNTSIIITLVFDNMEVISC